MTSFTTTRRVPHTPQQMFDLVADVEQYPCFFPLCEALRLRSRETTGDTEVLIAAMDLGYKSIRETVTSRVTLDRRRLEVKVDLIDGPFSQLDNRWKFTPAPGGATDVEFYIAYQFRSFMLQMLVGGLFDQAFRRCVSAFEARAHAVYGDQTIPAGGTATPATT